MTFSRRRFLATSSTLLAAPNIITAFDQDEIERELTRKSIQAVQKGMDWLNRARCPNGGYGEDAKQWADIGCSATVGLAMLADGSTAVQGPRKRQVREIASYLLKQVEVMPKSNITSKKGTQLQNKIGLQAHTFFALLFLSQVVGESHATEATMEACKKLVKAVVGSQKGDGSWGNTSWAPVLGTVMGWTSLRSSHFAGFDVGGSPEKTAEFLIDTLKKNLNQPQNHWMHNLYKNAAGIRVLYAMGKEKDPIVKEAFDQVIKLVTGGKTAFNQAGGEEYLAFHLLTEMTLQKGGADWKAWYPVVRDKIISVQNQDGSWTGHHCIRSRTFCTAAACLVLSAPNRYLPISQK